MSDTEENQSQSLPESSRYDPGTMSRLDVEDYVLDLEASQQAQLEQLPLDVRVRRDVQRRFFMFFGAVAVLSLTIGLSVHGSNVLGASQGPVRLASPSTSMIEVCAAAKDDGPSRQKCEDHCLVATCCRLPVGDELSCAVTSDSVCAEYEETCSHVFEEDASSSAGTATSGIGGGMAWNKIPLAPSHLADTCRKDNLVSDTHRKSCGELCQEFDDCCTVDGCLQANGDACGTYEPCKNLADAVVNHAPDQIPPAPNGLADVCSEANVLNANNRKTCKDLCAEFEDCCKRDACLEANEDSCATYDPCENLGDDAADGIQDVGVGVVVDVDPADVDKYCQSSSVLTSEGIQACRDACTPVLCCLVSPLVKEEMLLLRDVESCVPDKGAEWCDRYDGCKVLLQVSDDELNAVEDPSNGGGGDSTSLASSGIPPAPTDIGERCSQSSVSTSSGFVSCKEACIVSRCCWSVDEYDCAGDPPECRGYDVCVRLQGKEPGAAGEDSFDDDDDDDDDDVDDVSVAGEQTAAEDATPDVAENGNSDFGTPPVHDSTEEEASSGGVTYDEDDGKATHEKSDLEIAEEVIDTCTAAKMLTSDGRRACEKLCLSHLCCFAPENDCANALGAQCLEYAACKHLIDWSDRV